MIPKKIHYCWFGGNPLPESAQKCIASWKKYCPDYEIIEWNEKNVDVSSVAYMKEAYEEKAWGFVPDVARLQIIFNNGGIYLDTDVEIVRPFDNLLLHEAFAGIEKTNNGNYVALGLGFGAEKGSDFVSALLKEYETLHFKNADGTTNRVASPTLQSNIMRAMGFNGKDENQEISGAVIYSSKYFCPLSYTTGILNLDKCSYSIHHYMASWLTQDERDRLMQRHNIYKKYGSFLGSAVWNLFRFKDKVKKIGFFNTIKLLVKKYLKKA